MPQASPNNAPSIPGASSREAPSTERDATYGVGGCFCEGRRLATGVRGSKLRRVVSPAFRSGYLNVVTASLGELLSLFKSLNSRFPKRGASARRDENRK